MLTFRQGALSTAATFYEACLAGYQEVKDRVGATCALNGLGFVAAFQEDYARARSSLETSLRLHRENGDQHPAGEFHALGRVAFGEGNYAEAYTYYQQSLNHFLEGGYPHPPSLAFCLEGLVEVVLAQGHPLKATCILGCAEALRQTTNTIRPPIAQKRYEVIVTTLRLHLGEHTFQEARQQGQHIEAGTILQFAEHDNALSVPRPAQLSAPIVTTLSDQKMVTTAVLSEELTSREIEIFRLLANGLTKSQIAQQLTISFHTVNAHVRSIYAKTSVSSRSAATRYALEHGLT
jgi:DNA-binding NarL/FixJ family response regulator